MKRYDDSWFANDNEDVFTGGLKAKNSHATINDLDIDLLVSQLSDMESLDYEIKQAQEKMGKLVSDSERYKNLSARAFTEASEARSTYAESIRQKRDKLNQKEADMADSLAEVEKVQRNIATNADSALVQIKEIEAKNDKQTTAIESFSAQMKKTIKSLNQKYETTQSQLAGYTENLQDAKDSATDLISGFQTDARNLMSEFQSNAGKLERRVDEIGISLDEWRDTFEADAGDFQSRMQNISVVMDNLLETVASNTRDITSIKENAQKQARDIRESISQAQKDMHDLDALCAQQEHEATMEYNKLKNRMESVSGDFEANSTLLEQNQKEMEDVLTQLAQLIQEKKSLVNKCKANFQEAESVSSTFASYKQNLINSGISQIKALAKSYDDTASAMTGSAQRTFDVLDTSKGATNVIKEMEEANKQAQQGMDIFGTKQPKRNVYKPQPQPEPVYNPQPEPQPEPVYNPQPEPQPQPVYNPQPEPAPEPTYNQNQQSAGYTSQIDSDALMDDYLAQAMNPVEQDVPTGVFFDEMDDPAFNQNGNFMGTGTLIGENGTTLLEGEDNFGEFEMPYSPAPMQEEPDSPVKNKITGLFGRKKRG